MEFAVQKACEAINEDGPCVFIVEPHCQQRR